MMVLRNHSYYSEEYNIVILYNVEYYRENNNKNIKTAGHLNTIIQRDPPSRFAGIWWWIRKKRKRILLRGNTVPCWIKRQVLYLYRFSSPFSLRCVDLAGPQIATTFSRPKVLQASLPGTRFSSTRLVSYHGLKRDRRLVCSTLIK